MNVAILLTTLFHLLHINHGAEILAVFPLGGSSHYLVPQVLLKALAVRGHNLTVISSHRQKTPLPNFHDIDISSVTGQIKKGLSFKIASTVLQNTNTNLNYIANVSRTYCEIFFSFPQVQNLLNSGRKFDLVITEIFGADCAVGFAWKYKAPLISVLASRRTPWALSRVGNPENPAYMPMLDRQFSPKMTFMERLVNTYWYLYFRLIYEYRHNVGQTDTISRKFFGKDVPAVNEIIYNTSLVFVNNHYTIDQAHPMVPNYVEIAGIHVPEPKPLPSDIKKFMDEAQHGVIYFTLGSLIQVSTLPSDTIRAFRDAFAELPQKVLWKFELELEDIPPNVIISKWFPQTDIFNHPNLKLFITHGGNSGCIEAAHYGIPMVGIPLFFDQYKNIKSFVDKEVAIQLNMNDLTKENILSSIKTVVNNKSYGVKMKKLSYRFRDRPMSAVDTAVYWTEYVIRHKGAYHLKTVATEMPWYQYFLLDIILVCSFVLVISVFSLKYLIYFIFVHVKRFFFEKKLKTL